MGLHLFPSKARHVQWQYIFLLHWSFCAVAAPFPISIHHHRPYTYYYTKIWRQMPLSVKWAYTWLCLMHATESLTKMVQRLNWSIRRVGGWCVVSLSSTSTTCMFIWLSMHLVLAGPPRNMLSRRVSYVTSFTFLIHIYFGKERETEWERGRLWNFLSSQYD